MRNTLAWAAVLLLMGRGAAAGAPGEPTSSPCDVEAARHESAANVPAGLLAAIARVESGRTDGPGRAPVAWPWTISSNGKGLYFQTMAEAIDEVERLWAQGVRNIDVGCMQVSLLYHGEAFSSLAEALDPSANVRYAAEFLKQLKATSPTWIEAAGRYHSATPRHRDLYKAKVAALWGGGEPRRSGLPPVAARSGPGGSPGLLPPGMDWEWVARLDARLAFARSLGQAGRAPQAISRGESGAAAELAAALRAAAPTLDPGGVVPRGGGAAAAELTASDRQQGLAELRARLSALAPRASF